MADADLLAEVPWFALLDDQERAALAERLETVAIAAGQAVFRRGDPGGALYVVRSGVVDLSFLTDTGELIVLETVREGEFFGEISLLDGGVRTTDALVKEDMVGVVLTRDDLEEFLRLKPAAAMDLLAASGRRLRQNADLLRRTASRNVNEETEDNRTPVMRAADWISDFSGSLPFLFIHVGVFAAWIALNSGPLARFGGFDAFPYGLLTMCVSLEAIILSVFVLLSQNRQISRERVRNEIEYAVNLKAELEIAQLHVKVDHFNDEMLLRMDALEKWTRKSGAR